MGTSIRIMTSFPVDLTALNVSGVNQQGPSEIIIEPVEVADEDTARYQMWGKVCQVAEWEQLRYSQAPGEPEPDTTRAQEGASDPPPGHAPEGSPTIPPEAPSER